MDNKRALDAETQDTICKTSTGADFVERELYSQNSTAVAHLHNPIYITAVTNPIAVAGAQAGLSCMYIDRKPLQLPESSTRGIRGQAPGTARLTADRPVGRLASPTDRRRTAAMAAPLGFIRAARRSDLQSAGYPPGYFLERFETVTTRCARVGRRRYVRH